MKRVIAIAMATVLLGCGTTGTKQLLTFPVSERIIIGNTTKEQVRLMLGDPTRESVMFQNHNMYNIWHYEVTERRLNAACFIPFVDIAAGKQTVTIKKANIHFTPQGVVQDVQIEHSSHKNVAPIGTMLAIGAAAGAASSYGCSGRYGYYRGGYGRYNYRVYRGYRHR